MGGTGVVPIISLLVWRQIRAHRQYYDEDVDVGVSQNEGCKCRPKAVGLYGHPQTGPPISRNSQMWHIYEPRQGTTLCVKPEM